MGQGQPHEAARFLRALVAEGRGGLLARIALVRALLAVNDKEAAVAEAREAAALNPNIADAMLVLGDALQASSQMPAALLEFFRAARLEPNAVEPRLKLGKAWLEVGEADKALEQFRFLEQQGVAGVADLIGQADAIRFRARADAGYVRYLFDQFSATYETQMRQELQYKAPEVLRELADLVMPGARDLVALDLGCGTGFAAKAFADRTAAIDGIDLSPEMIRRARGRMLYRNLAVADFETALGQGGEDYDLILAADSLVYLGDLEPTLAGVKRRLKPGGFFLGTVEKCPHIDYDSSPKRRWRHSEGYLRKLAGRVGLEIAGLVACTPRLEQAMPVEGLAAAMRKPD